MAELLELDGSHGEGGGQILRSALALSAFTGKPFRITNIRKGRCTSGLKNQHLHCIKALEMMCDAKVEGAEPGSSEVTFYPGKMKGGRYDIDVGTAGSVTLLLQSLLVPSINASSKVRLNITGGTDVKWSMPFDYLKEIVVPHLRRFMDISLKLKKRGYYPEGGGGIEIIMKAKPVHQKIHLLDRGKLVKIVGVSHASCILMPAEVAERQAKSAGFHLGRLGCPVEIRNEYSETDGPGSGVMLWAVFSDGDSVSPYRIGADSLGAKGKRAEDVGEEAAFRLIKQLESDAPIDENLADNLVPFLGLFGGEIKATCITPHTTTNIAVVEKFLGVRFHVDERLCRISVARGYMG